MDGVGEAGRGCADVCEWPFDVCGDRYVHVGRESSFVGYHDLLQLALNTVSSFSESEEWAEKWLMLQSTSLLWLQRSNGCGSQGCRVEGVACGKTRVREKNSMGNNVRRRKSRRNARTTSTTQSKKLKKKLTKKLHFET